MSTHTSSTSCILCGSSCRGHAFNFQISSDDEVSISDDIETLDKAIHRLRLLKSQRSRQLNTIRSSTRILPNEILLSILRFSCPSFASRKYPQLKLGWVCSHWRNLVNNDPRFWRLMNLHVRNRDISKAASMLDVFKEHNGASFDWIALEFEYSRRQTNTFQQFISSMRGVLALSRISLDNPPVGLLQIINKLSPDDVSLSGLLHDSAVPELVPRFSLPWSAVTKLQLFSIEVNTCCELLVGCPTLVEFSCRDTLPPANGSILPDTQHARETHFPHLQHLAWHHENSEWDDYFLSFYRFPALQYFSWCGLDDHGPGYSLQLFRDFTTFLPQSCHTICIAAPDHSGAQLEAEMLQQVAHPGKQLIYSNFYMDTLAIALGTLEHPTFIPSLTLFRWDCGRYSDMSRDVFLVTIPFFKNVIRGRKEIGAGRPRFCMEIGGMLLPEGFTKGSCYELMGGGFNFEIDENGGWVIDF